MSNRLTFAAMATMLALATTGPASAQSPAAGDAGAPSGDLHLLSNSGGNATTMAAVIDAFKQKYPDVNVIQDSETPAELDVNMLSLYTSSDAPDVAWVQNDAKNYRTLVENGALLDVSDVYAAAGLDSALAPSNLAFWTSPDGKRYGVNYDQVWVGQVYYNKALFQQAGIEEPPHQLTSMAEFTDIVTKLKAAGIQPLSVGGSEFPAFILTAALTQNSSTPDHPYADYLTNWIKGSTDPAEYATGPLLTALQTLASWRDSGVFATGTPALTEAQSVSLFGSGGAAMLFDGSWVPDNLETSGTAVDIGWFLLPPTVTGAVSHFLTANGDGMGIPVKSKNIPAAKAFLEFLMSKEVQETIVPQSGVPSRTDLSPAAYSALNPVVQDMISQLGPLGAEVYWFAPPTLNDAILTGAEKVDRRHGDAGRGRHVRSDHRGRTPLAHHGFLVPSPLDP